MSESTPFLPESPLADNYLCVYLCEINNLLYI
jgi:hypothetical protein